MKTILRPTTLAVSAALLVIACPLATAQTASVDLTGYNATSGVEIRQAENRLIARWPMPNAETGEIVFDLRAEFPLIRSIGIAASRTGTSKPVLQSVSPATFLTVGTRVAPSGRPPEMSVWNVFFDKPSNRPYETFHSILNLKRVRVASREHRVTLTFGDLSIGSFAGDLVFTLYADSRLIQMESVVSTQEDARAIIYDIGLVGASDGLKRVAWMDVEGRLQSRMFDPQTPDTPMAVRHRTIAVEGEHGTLACFPPPHQFQFPRDLTDNFRFVWFGKGHQQSSAPFGFGVRQDPAGGGAFVPWFNAPPHVKHQLGVFFLLVPDAAKAALDETLRFTHGDRFPPLAGHITFTSHYHIAVAVTAMNLSAQRAVPLSQLPIPDFVGVFKGMGVDAVHLAEFHGDGHPKDTGPLRLPEMDAMFEQCRRLSNEKFLLIPGEEGNEFLGIREPGKHPGHWMSLFPKPVYWIARRQADEPFAEASAKYGTLYRVGNREDMMELLRRERGLAWSAHPRIKASSWAPDVFRHEDFYKAESWLGGAWKAMPADLSREKLGERVLDLMSDMANWGERKYVPGEVDVFKIDHTHELYGHMNINYVRLDRLPRYEEGWQPILDALREGRFFVTTGEILIREFTVGGRQSGQTLSLKGAEKPELQVGLNWTFPLRFAEVISGDGKNVFRERINLEDTAPFGHRTLALHPALAGRKWVRVEVWDVAANGAFTQPVWLE